MPQPPDERRGAFEDLVERLKTYEADEGGKMKKPVEVTDDLDRRMTEQVRELQTKLDRAGRMAVLRPIVRALDEIPAEVWHLVDLAATLEAASSFKNDPQAKESGVENKVLIAYDTARGNFSIGLRRELRDPDAFAKALVALHNIRQEVRRGARS